MTKKANAAEQLPANAERILTYSRKVLTAEIPELMPAFFLLRCDRTDVPGGLYTDGSTLYYHPETVVQNYLQDKRSICRQLLHIYRFLIRCVTSAYRAAWLAGTFFQAAGAVRGDL